MLCKETITTNMTITKTFLSLFLLFTTGCTSIEVRDYKPKKLTNIPESAFWKGGIDGGNWFLIKRINVHKNMVAISIYNDQDGSLIMSKFFMLVCNQAKQITLTNLKEQINFFDGKKIYINQSDTVDCFLQAKD
jgi:uncharacterized membrane protein